MGWVLLNVFFAAANFAAWQWGQGWPLSLWISGACTATAAMAFVKWMDE